MGSSSEQATRLIAILLIAFLGGSCFADETPSESSKPLAELSLEELMSVDVISSTQSSVKLGEAPSTISVVTDDQIRRWGIRRLSELIERLIPGAWALEDADDIILGFRGIAADNNSKVLLLINGHDSNTQWNNGCSSEVELGLLGDIKRVEVINGPGSALYGGSATIGVINLITRSGEDFHGVRATGNVGGGDYRKADLIAGGQKSSDLDYFFSMGGLSAHGYDNNRRPPLNISMYPPSYRFFGNIHYKDFSLMTRFTRSERDLYNIDSNLKLTTNYDTFFAVARQNVTVSDHTKLVFELSYDTLETQRHDIASGIKVRAVGEDHYGLKFTGQSVLHGTELVFGAEYRREEFGADWYDDNFNFPGRDANGQISVPPDPYLVRMVTPYGRDVLGLFAQDSYRLTTNTTLLLGLRYDRIESSILQEKGAFTPRIALVGKPNEKTVYKLMFSTGFRQPIAVLLSPDGFYFGNDGARVEIKHPEKVYSLELSGSYRLSHSANVTLNAFFNSIRNIHGIDPHAIPQLVGVFVSGGRLDYAGFEAIADWNLTHSIFLRAVQQHVQPAGVVEDIFGSFTTPDREHLRAYPQDATKLILDVRLSRMISFNVNSQLVWRVWGMEANTGTAFRSTHYSLLNANLIVGLTPRSQLMLSGYNLTDGAQSVPRVLTRFVPLAKRNFNLQFGYWF
jgi:outer membrane receptor for ferrienterochelin and colicins